MVVDQACMAAIFTERRCFVLGGGRIEWRPHQDSNLEHELRRPGIYPVNRWGREATTMLDNPKKINELGLSVFSCFQEVYQISRLCLDCFGLGNYFGHLHLNRAGA